jgi:two-component system, OmpR family, response regulator MprA
VALTRVQGSIPRFSAVHTVPLVLVVAGDARLASSLDRALVAAGYTVEHAAQQRSAVLLLEALSPDLLLLDGDAELARELRSMTDRPIVMLSAADGVGARVSGLDSGADDVLSMPFAMDELLARVRAVLRGRELAVTRRGRISYANVCRGTRKLELRNKGFELLACLMRRPERVLSRRDLLGEVWGYEFLGDSNVIEVTVSHVRQALEADGEPRLIHTVRPIGYILNARPSAR